MDNPFATGFGAPNDFNAPPSFGGESAFPSGGADYASEPLAPPQVDWSAAPTSNTNTTGGMGMPSAFGEMPPAFSASPETASFSDLKAANSAVSFAQEAAATLATAGNALVSAVAPASASGPQFEVTVTDPVEQKGTLSSHITYKVNVKTGLAQYQWREFSQIHRYSDFEWLWQELREEFPNYVVPPLPAKQVTGNKDPTFVAQRRWGLEQFLQHVVAHPELKMSRVLQYFLESSSETLPQAKKACQKEKEEKPGFWRRSKMAFKSLDKKYVDPELEAQKAAMQTLQNTVSRVASYTSRLCPARRSLGAIEADIGTNMGQFSETQEGSLAKACAHAADHYTRISSITTEYALYEAQAFSEVLNYQVGLLDAAGELFENRKTCAMTTQSYQNSCDQAATEFNKHKDNPSKQAKAQKAQAQFQECQAKLQAAEKHYAEFAASLPVELAQFEEARQKELLAALLEAAKQAKMYHEQMLGEWDRHHRQLASELSATF